MKLKERHYDEKLVLLTECAPAAARNVEKDAERMTKARKQIELEQAAREKKMKSNREEWETAEKERIAKVF